MCEIVCVCESAASIQPHLWERHEHGRPLVRVMWASAAGCAKGHSAMVGVGCAGAGIVTGQWICVDWGSRGVRVFCLEVAAFETFESRVAACWRLDCGHSLGRVYPTGVSSEFS